MTGRATPATAMLDRHAVTYTLHSYRHDHRSSSYSLEAATAIGLAPERVFKTIVAAVDGGLTIGVVPAAGRLDLKALAASVGGKRAKMAAPALAQRATGYVVGGISPLGLRTPLPVVVDRSALRFPTVFCSAGRRGLEVELAAADLVALTSAEVAGICC